MRETWLTLDAKALAGNVKVLRQAMPEARLLGMVKADAYGHGVRQIAPLLARQADALGVAFLDEALALRAQGIKTSIAVLEGVFTAAELAAARKADLQLAVHSAPQVELLRRAPSGRPVMAWVKVNTGMNRLGFRPGEALKAWHQLRELRCVSRLGLMTHFACADDIVHPMTMRQLSRFRTLQETLARAEGHAIEDSLANSAAILGWPTARGAWMRPGIALYGSSPFADTRAASLGLQPVMTLRSRVIATHVVPAGETVGYGAGWTATEDTRLAVVAIGYGDGYPRHAPSGTPVLINDRRCQLVGRVSMDMITVDLGSVPAQPGDEAVLWGQGLPADEVAAAAGTISYELFCRLTPRVRRPA